jgi:hypothetical protein
MRRLGFAHYLSLEASRGSRQSPRINALLTRVRLRFSSIVSIFAVYTSRHDFRVKRQYVGIGQLTIAVEEERLDCTSAVVIMIEVIS